MDFKNKNVLVTGGAGFIGSAIVRELLKEKANVTVYDNFSSGRISNLRELENDIDIEGGDILDPNFKNILENREIEYVFHLAALAFIPHCYASPRDFFTINANGTLNVLLGCRDAGVKRVLIYSSSEVYGSAKYVPMDENHPTLPLSTYAVSKLAADRLAFTLYHEQKVPVIILRQFNCVGPRETQNYVIPEIIAQLSRTNKLKLGNVKARRDFTYVEDAARGSVALMKCKRAVGGVVNMGTGKDYSIKELAEITGELMGHSRIKIEIDSYRLRPLDVMRLQCDYSLMKKLTGWKPRTDIRESLKKTIDWYYANGKKWVWETIAPEYKIWKTKKIWG